MSKFIHFTIVMSLTIASHAALVGHWEFDEPLGATTAVDGLGGADGVISGSVTTGVPGVTGMAYEFDGLGYVDMGNATFIPGVTGTSLSFSYWLKALDNGTGRNVAVFLGNDTVSDRYIDSGIENNDLVYGRDRGPDTFPEIKSANTYNDGQWHHVVFVIDAETGHQLYADGVLVASETTAFDLTSGINNFEIGRLGRSSPTDYFHGVIDDVRVYDEALTLGQIQGLFNPKLASNPVPSDGAIGVPVDHALSWTAGYGGSYTHDIYVGTDPENLLLISPSQNETKYTPVEEMEYGVNYYWRIDELENNQAISCGNIWTFQTYKPDCPSPPIGDIAGNDCVVNIEDLVRLIPEWLDCGIEPRTACP
jgi:hypothetical protein